MKARSYLPANIPSTGWNYTKGFSMTLFDLVPLVKKICTAITLLLCTSAVTGQTQLDIQGSASSMDTVARIRVNYSDSSHIVGLGVHSQPVSGYGIGAYLYGGYRGVIGESVTGRGVVGVSTFSDGVTGLSSAASGVYGQSTSSYGVYGRSTDSYGVFGLSESSWGVYGVGHNGIGVIGFSTDGIGVVGNSSNDFAVSGSSTNSHGAYFRGQAAGGKADIVLGGTNDNDDGVIMSDPDFTGSDIFLVSNDSVIIKLDNDTTGDASFLIQNDSGAVILDLQENGNMTVTGIMKLDEVVPPVSSPVNAVQLYADTADQGVDGILAELKVRDEQGNVTTLSPHNFSLIGHASEPLAWSFYSQNQYGKINVDMLRAVRLVEKLSGEKLVYIDNGNGEELLSTPGTNLKEEIEALKRENAELRSEIEEIKKALGIAK